MELESKELQEMRQQIALLKEKLDKEQIVSDNLMRNAIKQKMGSINVNAIVEYVAAAFVITFGSFVFWEFTHSEPFVIVTILYMLICAGATWWIHRNVNKNDANGDLLTTVKKIKTVKKQYQNWLWFGIPSLIIWALWFADLVLKDNNDEMARTLLISMGIGLVIGLLIGLSQHHRVVKTCNSIIEQIENVK